MKSLNDDRSLWSRKELATAADGDVGPNCCWFFGCCWYFSSVALDEDPKPVNG